MSDDRVPKVKYSLLHDETRQIIVNKSLVISLGIILGGFLLIGVFVIFLNHNEDKNFYPLNSMNLPVPESLVHRAAVYNNKSFNSFDSKPLYYEPKHKNVNNYKLVCYYNFPDEPEKYTNISNVLFGENIDPNLCTHINLAFASVKNNTLYIDAFQLNVSLAIIELKKRNPELKVLISVGGSGNDSGFPGMVLNHENRKQFIKSVLYYIKEYKFDGVDIDWEFPNENVTPDLKQRVHFTQLLEEIRKEINRQERHKFLLTVAVAAPTFLVDNCYDVPYINQYVDFINLMSYDYHFYTKYTPYTGINAPLYSGEDIGYFATLNINYSTHYWNFKGLDKEKIIVGLPTYGHSYRLFNQDNNKINAPSSGYGKLGNLGFVDYASTCTFLEKNKIVPIFDETTQSPYATKYLEWLSYDDIKSLKIKADFIKKHNFGGAMIYSLNTDDHIGACHLNDNKKPIIFPLVTAIKSVLNDPQL